MGLGLIGKTYLTGPPGLWLGLKQSSDKVFGVLTNVLPILFVKDHVGCAALVDEFLECFGAERRVTA